MYICAGERQTAYSAIEDIEQPDSGNRYTAGSMRHAPLITGVVAAMDLRTNRRLWAQRWPGRCYSGLVTTAGDLLFAGRNDGRLTAMDSRDGTKLWEFMTDAGVNAPPAVFEHDGKQYVAVFSAGNLLARSNRGDSMWLFTLLEDDQEGAGAQGLVNAPTANPVGQRLFQIPVNFATGAVAREATVACRWKDWEHSVPAMWRTSLPTDRTTCRLSRRCFPLGRSGRWQNM